jgi:sensor histidine kinase YesM
VIKPAFWETWWGILLITLNLIGLVVLFVQWRIKRVKRKEKEKADINQKIAEYRFTALKAQMDPHFVFNSINVIQNLILEKDRTEAYNSLEKFARLIRLILNQSDSVFATVEEELTLINLYVELNQLRVEYPFEFHVDIEEKALHLSIPSLIMQPFIENALWHGILGLKGSRLGIISLKIACEAQSMLTIQIRDNGVGRATASQNRSPLKHKSKGITLIKERLQAYKAMNSNSQADLVIMDLEENGIASGTLVEIKITVNDEY